VILPAAGAAAEAPVHAKALREAARKAHASAESTADALGLKLVGVLSAEEAEPQVIWPVRMTAMVAGPNARARRVAREFISEISLHIVTPGVLPIPSSRSSGAAIEGILIVWLTWMPEDPCATRPWWLP